ncbi:hypothetical protein PAXRUDRAFT_168707 [Paxillus rubicundulus Ve08.2h10]|uniref:Homeodomain transcription factor HD1 n=1 Tax=Paxillus rubicundulus Ve08.2h10 TaxID=930991 RepID=A0A0D0CZU2_9AGAM|nr:hypothetical protein PAXRUDRAFT_168707 [Paxillus rubicundulus Ve08.2h10]
MDLNVRQRFNSAETMLFLTLGLGGDALSSYESTWATLQDDFTNALSEGYLSEETLRVAHTVASNVATVADCFVDIENKHNELLAELHRDWEQILDGMSRIQISHCDSFPYASDSCTTFPTSTSDLPVPSFIASAYRWLLLNLHNPYPSADVKAAIVEASKHPIGAVNAWFVNVRRRMGWTTLCREYFHNCRADAADAAYRALVKEDPNRRLSPDLIHAFIVMKVTAEGLYSSTFTKSALAGDLDAVVKDMTAEDRKLAEEIKRLEGEAGKHAMDCEKESSRKHRVLVRESPRKLVAQDSYPSPEQSYTSSPAPTLDDSLTESDDGEANFPPVVAGRKRRPSSEVVDLALLTPDTRPMKRLRYDSSNDDSSAAAHTPSLSPAAENHANIAVSRKRRLSDADARSMLKHPRGSQTGPRLHPVSDLLPHSNVESEHSVDEWFSTNFDALFALPPPVDAAEPDFSAQWEVELFSDYSMPRDLQSITAKPPSLCECVSTHGTVTKMNLS